MVAYPKILASNAQISSSLAPDLVAVFVGATSGIGEYSLRALVKHAVKPRIYFVGRSQDAATRIVADCREVNPEAELIFLKSDVSLIRNVDEVCREIAGKEKTINLICLSQGVMYNTIVTDEGLRAPIALVHYSRVRFLVNLLPLVERAKGLRRVLSIFAGGKEGPINMSDLRVDHGNNPLALRGHMAAMQTFALETLATRYPTVSFVHDFPGPVRSQIARDKNILNFVLRSVFAVVGPFIYIPNEESGERHVFIATSARYPAASTDDEAAVELADGVVISKGADGKLGSGIYTTDAQCEASNSSVDAVLDKMRKEGVPQKAWEHTEAEFVRMVGSAAITQ
ncbi:hypothetical protein LTR56_000687 [Elasticomyces elasticus]|nr:hypothetical protein LTR22_013625 [Elasticomyces elasticus]KAK3660311.1 hypothetical protein LTR56_000687 [Elasticomyces elasticus]KAK5733709.1 hypothetical protein LTS12_026880 [Elasticomyces elasticus]